MYTSEDISALFEHAVNLIDIDTEAAIHKFNEGNYRAGHCMLRTVVAGNVKDNLWFDHELALKVAFVTTNFEKIQQTV